MKLIPKKSLGQHFLRSESALQMIVAAANLTKSDFVIEIGPGEGVLTEKLIKECGKVLAVEKDRRSVDFLKEKFVEEIKSRKLILEESDILELKFPPNSYKVVANIPYYISGALIRFFLEAENQPNSMTLLLQKEVVERIVAKDKKESILSISVKAYGMPRNCGMVKAGSFFPPPKVDSAILHVDKISKDLFSGNKISEKLFFDILHAGFSHKRKLLKSNLKEKNFILPVSVPGTVPKYLVPENSRAEDLKLEDWILIAKSQ